MLLLRISNQIFALATTTDYLSVLILVKKIKLKIVIDNHHFDLLVLSISVNDLVSMSNALWMN